MPTLYDAETGQPATVAPDSDEAHAGVVSGQLRLDADAAPVPLQGKDGAIYSAPPEKVASALATGAYRMLSPEDEIKHSVAKEERAKGVLGSIEAAGSSALNQALLGVPEALHEAIDTPEEHVRREAEESYHSVARTVGGASGILASSLFGGEILKGAELAGQAVEHAIVPAEAVGRAALASRMAAKAAGYAAQGAALSSPQALIQAVVGNDPQKAAETLLWGIGAGAALGGGAGLVEAGTSAIGEGIASRLRNHKTQQWLDEWANERTLKSFGAERSQLNKLSSERISDLANFTHDEGLLRPGMSRRDLGDVVERAQDKWGKTIGDTIESLDGLLHRGEGAAIGPKPPPEIIDAAIKPGDLGDAIRNALQGPELAMPMNADQAHAIEMVAKSADAIQSTEVNGQRVVTFEDAQKFVSDLRKKWVNSIKRADNEGGVKGLEVVTPLDRAKADAYQVARKAVHEAADRVAVASKEPKLVGALQQAKTQYAKLSQLESFAQTFERVRAGNRMIGLTDMIHMGQGPMTAATTAMGAAMGALAGPGGAIVGAHMGRIPGLAMDLMAKRWMEDKGLVYLTALAKRAAREGPDVFSAVMASEGAKRLQSTMNTVQDTLRSMAVRGTVATSPAGGSDHMRHLLASTQGLSAEQQHERLGTHLASLAGNPAAMATAVAASSAPFAAASPPLGAAYQQQLAKTLQYLHDAFPRAPAPPLPFAPDDWEPTAQQKLDFHDKAEIVNNPMRAMVHVARGTLSNAHMDALQTIYPSVLGELRNTILTSAAKHPEMKLPLAERRSLGKLLGQPLDAFSASLSALQASYATGGPGQPPQPPGQRAPKGKIKNMPTVASAFSASAATPADSGA